MDLVDLSGKKIVITGASSGVGRAVAILVSQLGGHGVLIARRGDELQKTADMMKGHSALYVSDLEDIDRIGDLVRRLVDEQGPVDGFVHCAGVLTTVGLRGITTPVVEKTMKINFYSFLELAKNLTASGAYRPGMSMVGISSAAASQGHLGKTLYSASKAALESAIRCLARELAPKNIRANCVAPAIIRTPLLDLYLKQAGASNNVREALARQYLGIGEPEDVAAMVAFLLSSASRLITGATLPVDGGKLSS